MAFSATIWPFLTSCASTNNDSDGTKMVRKLSCILSSANGKTMCAKARTSAVFKLLSVMTSDGPSLLTEPKTGRTTNGSLTQVVIKTKSKLANRTRRGSTFTKLRNRPIALSRSNKLTKVQVPSSRPT